MRGEYSHPKPSLAFGDGVKVPYLIAVEVKGTQSLKIQAMEENNVAATQQTTAVQRTEDASASFKGERYTLRQYIIKTQTYPEFCPTKKGHMHAFFGTDSVYVSNKAAAMIKSVEDDNVLLDSLQINTRVLGKDGVEYKTMMPMGTRKNVIRTLGANLLRH